MVALALPGTIPRSQLRAGVGRCPWGTAAAPDRSLPWSDENPAILSGVSPWSKTLSVIFAARGAGLGLVNLTCTVSFMGRISPWEGAGAVVVVAVVDVDEVEDCGGGTVSTTSETGVTVMASAKLTAGVTATLPAGEASADARVRGVSVRASKQRLAEMSVSPGMVKQALGVRSSGVLDGPSTVMGMLSWGASLPSSHTVLWPPGMQFAPCSVITASPESALSNSTLALVTVTPLFVTV
jgi:hypothetical protein